MIRCETHQVDHAPEDGCPNCKAERRTAAMDALFGLSAPEPEPEPEPAPAPTPAPKAEPEPAPVVEPEPQPQQETTPAPDPVPLVAASAEETARIQEEIRRLESDLDAAPAPAPATAPNVAPDAVSTPPIEPEELEAASDAPATASAPTAESATPAPSVAPSPSPSPSRPARPPEPEMSAARIQELIDKKANVIGLLGFPGAGKTWFLNRLKYELFTSREDRHEAIPPHAAQWDAVGRTNGVSEHFFRASAEGAPSSFYVIDIPGERFISLAEGRFLGRERELLALKACKALIIVAPADEVLLGERASALYSRPGADSDAGGLDAKARAMAVENVRLERFTANIAQLNVVLSLLDQKVEVAKIAAMTSEDLIRHLDSSAYRPSSKPVFVALSKADVIEAQAVASFKAQEENADQPGSLIDLLYRGSPADIEALQEFDRDPEEIVDRYRPALASAINAFRWSKFDFVTAFRGHGDGDIGGTVVDYTLGRRGVAAVLRWMEWARTSDTGLTRSDWRAIAAARGLRRFRNEGRFKRLKKADQFR